MGLLTKMVKTKWNKTNKKYYQELGYTYTKIKDEFDVKVNHLSKWSKINVEVKCDGENCGKTILVQWTNYNIHVQDDGKYYCVHCTHHKDEGFISFEQWCYDSLTNKEANEVLSRWDYDLNELKPSEISFGTQKKYWFKCLSHIEHHSELKGLSGFRSGQKGSLDCKQCNSFAQWCINNSREDWLNLWDYDLNDCFPTEIAYSKHIRCYFKCPKGIHKSEQKNINSLTSGHEGGMDCKQCNSFAQYLIDTYGDNALDLYWDYKLNEISPWEISKSGRKPVYIKCQDKLYHESYREKCHDFFIGNRCPYCHGLKTHPRDSLGQYIIDNFGVKFLVKIWSDKNDMSPFTYRPKSSDEVWWKCLDEKHEDFYRRISGSNISSFRCPECQFSKGEKMIEKWLIKNGFKNLNLFDMDIYNNHYNKYTPQKPFDGLLGLKGGSLSYDFYLPQHNLLIEYQGEQHEHPVDFRSEGIEVAEENFIKQQEHDRRKKEYAQDNNIDLLPIWYWDYDKIDEILNKIHKNIEYLDTYNKLKIVQKRNR